METSLPTPTTTRVELWKFTRDQMSLNHLPIIKAIIKAPPSQPRSAAWCRGDVVRHHHRHRPKERLQVVRQLGSARVAGVHGDEAVAGPGPTGWGWKTHGFYPTIHGKILENHGKIMEKWWLLTRDSGLFHGTHSWCSIEIWLGNPPYGLNEGW